MRERENLISISVYNINLMYHNIALYLFCCDFNLETENQKILMNIL